VLFRVAPRINMPDAAVFLRSGRLAMIIEPGAVVLDELIRVSFQRYPESAFSPHAIPRSHGALPVGLSKDGVPMVPLTEGEALWIGLRFMSSTRNIPVKAMFLPHLREGSHRAVDPAPIEVDVGLSPLAIIWLLNTKDGRSGPIVRGSRHANIECTFFEIVVMTSKNSPGRKSNLLIRLCSYGEFTAATGLPDPAPIETVSTYGGWRLP
jgi:hypothetical protein